MSKFNILYILADDLGWGDLSLHDSPIRTPNIDRLAFEGIEFTQHYVCPMCTPTRVSLLTGRHPGRFGAHATVPSNPPVLRDGYHTMASVLREAGYDTGLFGKWHLGSAPQFGPNNFGFNTSYGSLAGGVDPFSHRYKEGQFSFTWHRNGQLVEENGHVTDLLVREATEWIESRDRPWFCYVPFTAVHTPIKPTQEWMARYYHEQYDDDPLKDYSFKKYAAYTSHMDHGVGELLAALDRTCQRENTLVIFASDNGAINDCPIHDTDLYPGWQEACPRLGSNAPYRGVKAQLYEGGIRTPLVMSWRSKLAPGTIDTPTQVVDWMPTLLSMTDSEPMTDPQFDGQDLSSLILGHDCDRGAEVSAGVDAEVTVSDSFGRNADRRFYWNFRMGNVLGLRHGDWKLINRKVDGDRRNELFNIAKDPYEEHEVAADYPERVRELSDMIDEERQLDGSSARDDVDSVMVE